MHMQPNSCIVHRLVITVYQTVPVRPNYDLRRSDVKLLHGFMTDTGGIWGWGVFQAMAENATQKQPHTHRESYMFVKCHFIFVLVEKVGTYLWAVALNKSLDVSQAKYN